MPPKNISNLFVLDYNDTIVLGIERISQSFCEEFFGKELFQQIKNISKNKGNSVLDRYIKDDEFTLTINEVRKFWENFKSRKYYNVLSNKNEQRIKETIENIENKLNGLTDNITSKELKEICCNYIINPLIAMYNVYVTGVRPEESFKTFVAKCIDNNSELAIINTNSPQSCIEYELCEFIECGYEYLKYFTKNKLIFGCNSSSSKKQEGRISNLVSELKERGYIIQKDTNIIVIGDTEKDIENFKEIDSSIFPKSKIFILTKRVNDMGDLQERSKIYKKEGKSTERIEKEITDISERKKRFDEMKKKKENIEFVENFDEISVQR